MHPTPRWFWLAALVPLANAVGLVALYRYDHAHPNEVARWATTENVGMALSLYVGFILLLYLLFLVCGGPTGRRAPSPELETKNRSR